MRSTCQTFQRQIAKVTFLFILSCGFIPVHAQKISVEALQFIVGQDSMPVDDMISDTVMFFDRSRGSFYTGILDVQGGFDHYIDSFGTFGFGAGYSSIPKGYASVAIGAHNLAEGYGSIALGSALLSNGYLSTSLGIYNDPIESSPTIGLTDGSPLLIVGNGTLGGSIPERHNALTVYYDGSLEINEEYTMPNADGTVDQVLKTDGNGDISWSDDGGVFELDNGVVSSTGDHFNDDFVFGTDALPEMGGSTVGLFFFDKSKRAFRAGSGGSDAWVADSIGLYSFAAGYQSKAIGTYSTAFGRLCRAVGSRTFAAGSGSEALGIYSVAIGQNALSVDGGVAMGRSAEAIGFSSVAFSNSTANGSLAVAMAAGTADGTAAVALGGQASGNHAFASGDGNAQGWFSTAMGRITIASGVYTTALGYFTDAQSYSSLAMGRYNVDNGNDTVWVSTDPIFSIGNGQNSFNKSNALTVLKNGSHVFGASEMPSGNVSDTLFFYDNTKGALRMGGLINSDNWDADSLGYLSTAFGMGTVALGQASFAAGWGSKADGTASVAMGLTNSAYGQSSAAFGSGTKAYGDQASALGANTEAIGNNASAFGYFTEAGSFGSVAMGQFNVGGGTDDTWVPSESLLELGNGSSTSDRANALTVLKNGKTGIGTHLPDELLDVRGTQQIKRNSSGSTPHLKLIEESTTDYARIQLQNENPETYWTIAARPYADTISSLLNFYLDGVGNVMSIKGTNRVGIRASNPESALQVNAVSGDNALRIQTASSTKMLVLSNGGISLGGNHNTTTANDVYIANQLYFNGISDNPTHRIHLPNDSDDADGKGLAFEWAVYSDRRVKKDIEPLTYGLHEILALQPVSFDHHTSQFTSKGLQLTDESERQIGFLAQEVHEILPELVNQPEDDSQALWSMDYERLTPVLVRAIQELVAQNDTLRAQMDAREAAYSQLEDRLSRIEAALTKEHLSQQ